MCKHNVWCKGLRLADVVPPEGYHGISFLKIPSQALGDIETVVICVKFRRKDRDYEDNQGMKRRPPYALS